MSDQTEAVDRERLRDDRQAADEAVRSHAIDEAVREGELTTAEAAEVLRAAVRHQAAEQGPALDTDADGTITEGGFGAGQGMAKHTSRHKDQH